MSDKDLNWRRIDWDEDDHPLPENAFRISDDQSVCMKCEHTQPSRFGKCKNCGYIMLTSNLNQDRLKKNLEIKNFQGYGRRPNV